MDDQFLKDIIVSKFGFILYSTVSTVVTKLVESKTFCSNLSISKLLVRIAGKILMKPAYAKNIIDTTINTVFLYFVIIEPSLHSACRYNTILFKKITNNFNLFSLLIIKNRYYNTMIKYFCKFLILFLFFNFSLISFSKEEDASSSWGENSEVFNKGFEDQKPVSDSKLKKTIDQIKERQLSRKQRKIKKEVQPLSPSSDLEHLKEFTESQSPDNQLSQTHTVMIPMKAYNEDGKYIQPGYYKLSCRKIGENNYVLDLSQGNVCILSVPAIQTSQDLEQDTITFCNAEILDNGRIRLMYGSIDLNLVGYIYFK